MTMPCPGCNKELQKIPIYEDEIETMRDAMKEAHSIQKDATGVSKYPWYCRDCYKVVEDTTVACSGCGSKLNAKDAEKYRNHER